MARIEQGYIAGEILFVRSRKGYKQVWRPLQLDDVMGGRAAACLHPCRLGGGTYGASQGWDRGTTYVDLSLEDRCNGGFLESGHGRSLPGECVAAQ